VSIHDKHIELIVRQMLRRVLVAEPGDAPFLPGDASTTRSTPRSTGAWCKKATAPAEGRPELMGITKASLATDSWLSAASFQETTRVLTEAAIEGSPTALRLKENIIIGKLIPPGPAWAGTATSRSTCPDAAGVSLRTYGFDEETEDLAAWLRDVGGPTRPVATRASARAGLGEPGFGELPEPGAAPPGGVRSTPGRPIPSRCSSNGEGTDHGVDGNGQLEPALDPTRRRHPRPDCSEDAIRSRIACSLGRGVRKDPRARQFREQVPKIPQRSRVPTIEQARPQGTCIKAVQDQDAGAQRRAPASWRLHARLHDNAEEAELGAAQGGPGAAHEWGRGKRLYPPAWATTSRSTPSCWYAGAV